LYEDSKHATTQKKKKSKPDKSLLFPKQKLEKLRIIEAAANYIQKVYRGYRTRMLLRDHLRKLLVAKMI